MSRFAAARPSLFHVADRAALDSIRTHGLLSATALVALHAGDPAWLTENRDAYCSLAPGVTLRRQFLRDGPLLSRLVPGVSPQDWRRTINGFVFLFPTEAAARRLLAFEPGRDQVILRFATAALSGLLGCRFNNGMVDRSAPAQRRLRGPADYQPVDALRPAEVKEVAVPNGLDPAMPFSVL